MKRLFLSLLASLFIFNFGLMDVKAEETVNVTKFNIHECSECDEVTVTPRIAMYMCPNCASYNTTSTYKSTGNWYKYTTNSCAHYSKGQDEIQKRDVVLKITCNDCGYFFTMNKTETQTICHGYN